MAAMEISCARCGTSLRTEARFCPECGNPSPAAPTPQATQSSQAAQAVQIPGVSLQLAVDTEAMRHFAVGTRCALRMRVATSGAVGEVGILAEVHEGEKLPPAKSAIAAHEASTVLTLWLVPSLAGFYELRGVVYALSAQGERHAARFSGLQFRVAADTGPRVSVVNIDQRSARVVDNSRTNFAIPENDRAGLVGSGEWHEVPLAVLTSTAAAALFGDAQDASAAGSSERANSYSTASRPGAPVRFNIRAENAAYDVSAVLAQGELATIYDGRRASDGARVAVKIADDRADNDLIAAEQSALALLTAEDSPQRKHLPQILDRFHTRDGRLGTVFTYLDGLDLTEAKRRLPDGLPARHLIWLMRRCLSLLGFAHSRGVLHGNLDPAHILVRARDHNVWLIDWCYAIVNPAQTGQSFRCLNETYSPPEVEARKPPLPASDLYSLGKSMLFILGGDPTRKTMPDGLDERLQRFLNYCMLESPLSRAGDAWDAYRQLDRLRQEIWGPHEFIELHL